MEFSSLPWQDDDVEGLIKSIDSGLAFLNLRSSLRASKGGTLDSMGICHSATTFAPGMLHSTHRS